MMFLKKIFAPIEVKVAIGVLDEIESELHSKNIGCTIFKQIRQLVESTIWEQPQKFVLATKQQNRTPRQKVYSMLEHVAGDYLQSGNHDFFVYRGTLTPKGEALLGVYDFILDQMREINYITETEAEKQKNNIRDRINEGG